MEQSLLEIRVEMKVLETIDLTLEGDWVDHKKVGNYNFKVTFWYYFTVSKIFVSKQ